MFLAFLFLLAPFLRYELLILLLVFLGNIAWVILYPSEAFHVLLFNKDVRFNAALKIVEEVFVNICVDFQILFILDAQ